MHPGDFVAHRTVEAMAGRGPIGGGELVGDTRSFPNPALCSHLAAFVSEVVARGVLVAWSFPPRPTEVLIRDGDLAARLETVLRQIPGLVVLDAPTILDAYPTGYFYDSANHLTAEGAGIRTDKLIAALRRELERAETGSSLGKISQPLAGSLIDGPSRLKEDSPPMKLFRHCRPSLWITSLIGLVSVLFAPSSAEAAEKWQPAKGPLDDPLGERRIARQPQARTERRRTPHIQRIADNSPHEIRLRPAPHCRTLVLGYSLNVTPDSPYFLNWQQDPYGNWVARLVFTEPATALDIVVDLTADMSVVNPFDFFVEPFMPNITRSATRRRSRRS